MLKSLFKQRRTDSVTAGFDPNSENRGSIETVFYYHSETKHHFDRYARSLGYLDWANQPEPFRRFEGAPILQLPFMTADDTPPYSWIYGDGPIAAKAVSLQTVGQFFELSLALSAWKEFRGNRWALRINPSSGNLHPTEGYLVIGPPEGAEGLPGLGSSPMVCHYAPKEHCLEIRAHFSRQNWHSMMAAFPAGSFLVGLSSIHWREAWKYGERAFRYCQHDIGHALAALRLSATLLGWELLLLQDLSDCEVAQILGLDRDADFADAEREHPDLLAVVVPNRLKTSIPLTLPTDLTRWVIDGIWQGKANRLSEEHVDWKIIDQVAVACEKPHTDSGLLDCGLRNERIADCGMRISDLKRNNPQSNNPQLKGFPSARKIIFQRRSAVALDAKTEIYARDFYRVLGRTMPGIDPGAAAPPWDAISWPPSVHLCLFVHRIYELLPGLYVLVRDPEKVAALRAAMRPDFLWEKPPECPNELPLYFLMEGNCQRLASQVSCWQDIGGDGVFSLGMVADFEVSLHRFGAWYYRRLFWETGMIGQVLYLEAEAIGIRATGIGCFFDDPVHEVFGFNDWKYQSLYHFTMGGPVEDSRLTTLPPYSPEEKQKS